VAPGTTTTIIMTIISILTTMLCRREGSFSRAASAHETS
jgi:hypothetical protein